MVVIVLANGFFALFLEGKFLELGVLANSVAGKGEGGACVTCSNWSAFKQREIHTRISNTDKINQGLLYFCLKS